MGNDVITLKEIGKEYLISHQKPTLLGSLLGRKPVESFWALKKVNLTIRRGAKVGLFGPNGAGKTTLLKIIAGITAPTTGVVKTNGKIISLMRLEAGFHPDLSGRENLYLNGLLAGMTKDEVHAKAGEIINFSGVGDFIEAPFHTFSEGMKFRLAFSIAITSEFDILIIDEIITAGDIHFQEKVLSTLEKINKNRNVTVIICSHFPQLVWRFAEIFYEIDKKGRLKSVNQKDMLKLARAENENWKKHLHL